MTDEEIVESTEEVEETTPVEAEEASEVESEEQPQEEEKPQEEESDQRDAEIAKLKRQLKQATKKLEKPSAKPSADLSPTDVIQLMKDNVTETDDINNVVDYAKFKGITVTEALKLGVVKTMLADSKQERETANATSTKGGKRGISTPSTDEILAKAAQGELPDDPIALAKARMAQKQTK